MLSEKSKSLKHFNRWYLVRHKMRVDIQVSPKKDTKNWAKLRKNSSHGKDKKGRREFWVTGKSI